MWAPGSKNLTELLVTERPLFLPIPMPKNRLNYTLRYLPFLSTPIVPTTFYFVSSFLTTNSILEKERKEFQIPLSHIVYMKLLFPTLHIV